ncbi:MAG: DNA-directed RNA polymerase subunit H [Thermoplasmata archaeon]|nr:DNA-directed RNA polymerase subunit H [Thermoplasmata archaeon]HDD60135.1 DNA-directed RNA polymerase subunit H [Euryarchaeota archaeon]RLF56314.1 MAG: DNA-directed RNA polymerase subunit H [Thermoplasmata archaeon]RLF72117.1 MAG: DNA-directed RNA polymerase subunit H [Thermoplasmata archaeon]RLF72535.1 MAG: DNA-directed RNA polymerase subunit H [Thermoplasmata archaeon]
MEKINVLGHRLVPRHRILNEEEKQELLKRYRISLKDLPKILITDPMVKAIGANIGDVIEIERISPTAGISHYYRYVVEDKPTI